MCISLIAVVQGVLTTSNWQQSCCGIVYVLWAALGRHTTLQIRVTLREKRQHPFLLLRRELRELHVLYSRFTTKHFVGFGLAYAHINYYTTVDDLWVCYSTFWRKRPAPFLPVGSHCGLWVWSHGGLLIMWVWILCNNRWYMKWEESLLS